MAIIEHSVISETQLQSLITTAAQYFFPNQAVINRYKEVLGICRIITPAQTWWA